MRAWCTCNTRWPKFLKTHTHTQLFIRGHLVEHKGVVKLCETLQYLSACFWNNTKLSATFYIFCIISQKTVLFLSEAYRFLRKDTESYQKFHIVSENNWKMLGNFTIFYSLSLCLCLTFKNYRYRLHVRKLLVCYRPHVLNEQLVGGRAYVVNCRGDSINTTRRSRNFLRPTKIIRVYANKETKQERKLRKHSFVNEQLVWWTSVCWRMLWTVAEIRLILHTDLEISWFVDFIRTRVWRHRSWTPSNGLAAKSLVKWRCSRMPTWSFAKSIRSVAHTVIN